MENNKLFNWKNELFIIVLITIPVILYYIYQSKLPDQLPSHFTLSGEVNDFMEKGSFIGFVLIINIIMYLLLLFLPKIDPKGKIGQMGHKLFALRLILTALMSFVFSLIIINAAFEAFDISKVLFPFVLILFIILGNYLQSVKPNYFIGIRTPWALQSEENWSKTHRFTGRIWIITAGLLLILYPFLPTALYIKYGISAILILVFIPILYSFIYYLKFKNRPADNS